MRLTVMAAMAALLAAVVLSACGSSSSSSSSSSEPASSGSSGGSTEGTEGTENVSTDSSLKPFEETVATAEKEISAWPSDAPTEPVKIEPDKLLVFITCGNASPGCRVIGEGAQEAAKLLGWEFKMLDGEFSPSKQRADFEQAIALEPNQVQAIPAAYRK